jgi:hypothetical protein
LRPWRTLATGKRARQLHNAGQGQPDAVRSPDDGLRPSDGQPRGDDGGREQRSLRAQRLQARHRGERLEVSSTPRRRLRHLHQELRPRHRTQHRRHQEDHERELDAGHRSQSTYRIRQGRYDCHRGSGIFPTATPLLIILIGY